jgi:DMSO/TMAO reductase YedYZ molybdopterin-dependent catalytic subunit
MMSKLNFSLTLTLFVIALLSGCSPDRGKNVQTSGTTSIKNMVTPEGKKLLSVEDGPVRDIMDEPAVDLDTFKLEITGLVDSSYFLTWNEIKDFPGYDTDTILMYCVEGWEVWGRWKGILVKDLLDKAGVDPAGKYVLFGSPGNYTTSLPISYLVKYNAILAYSVNGRTLKTSNGFPLRLIAFGKLGYKWAKTVYRLEVIEESQAGFWEGYGYQDKADVPVSRRQHYEGQDVKPLEY